MDPARWFVASKGPSLFSINVGPSVQQKCHPFGLRCYQMEPLLMRRARRSNVFSHRVSVNSERNAKQGY